MFHTHIQWNNQFWRKKAFTLVEMLIVVVIIWILAAALIPRLVWAQSQARDVARKKWMSDIYWGLEAYYNNSWKYPDWIDEVPCTNYLSWYLVSWGYMSDIPVDPQRNKITYHAENVRDFPNPNPASWQKWYGMPYCLSGNYWYVSFKNPEWNFIPNNIDEPTCDSWKKWNNYNIWANMENAKNSNFAFETSGDIFWHCNWQAYYRSKICPKVNLVKNNPQNCEVDTVNNAVFTMFSLNN